MQEKFTQREHVFSKRQLSKTGKIIKMRLFIFHCMNKKNFTIKLAVGLFFFLVGLAILQKQLVLSASIDPFIATIGGIISVVIGITLFASIFVD